MSADQIKYFLKKIKLQKRLAKTKPDMALYADYSKGLNLIKLF